MPIRYTLIIRHYGDEARLQCASLEEAQRLRQSFINYGQYQEVEIVNSAS